MGMSDFNDNTQMFGKNAAKVGLSIFDAFMGFGAGLFGLEQPPELSKLIIK